MTSPVSTGSAVGTTQIPATTWRRIRETGGNPNNEWPIGVVNVARTTNSVWLKSTKIPEAVLNKFVACSAYRVHYLPTIIRLVKQHKLAAAEDVRLS